MKHVHFRNALAFTALILLITSNSAFSENEIITIEGATIRGNQELPTVLYVVPWQAPKIYKLETPKSNLAVQRPIEGIERESFKRLITYHELFKSKAKITK